MTIERYQAVPGMFRFQIDGKDVFSSVTASRRPKMIFVAGQLATSEKGEIVGAGDMRAQIRQVCENIKLPSPPRARPWMISCRHRPS